MNISGKLVTIYYVISDGCVQTASCVNMIIPEIGNGATFPKFQQLHLSLRNNEN